MMMSIVPYLAWERRDLISDACVWRVKDESGQVVGLISSHVDDFLMGGSRESKVWSEFLHKFQVRV